MMDPLRIAVAGVSGGAGRTTIVAHVARALHESGLVPMAFDLDPQNTLGLHLGMKLGEALGIARPELAFDQIPRMLRRHHARVPYLPFGVVSDRERRVLERKMEEERGWLARRIRGFMPRNCSVALLDTAAAVGPWQRAAFEAADLVVMVARPDPACFAALPLAERVLSEVFGSNATERSVWVLSRFDACRPLDRDLRIAFQHALQGRLVPVHITECVSVGEALARNDTVDLQERSQVALEFSALAEELKTRAQVAGSRPDPVHHADGPERFRLTAIAGGHEGWLPDDGKGRYYVKG